MKIMKNKILVLGGKGKTGRKVAERLTKLDQMVRIGSRSESPSFDWQDPSTWSPCGRFYDPNCEGHYDEATDLQFCQDTCEMQYNREYGLPAEYVQAQT